jgi:hypothetical protein
VQQPAEKVRRQVFTSFFPTYGKTMMLTDQNHTRSVRREPVSCQFYELIIDQTLEQMLLPLPFRAHQTIFLYLGMEPPSRGHENTETAKTIRAELTASEDISRTLQDIQQRWCQPALRKILLKNISAYDITNLMPPFDNEYDATILNAAQSEMRTIQKERIVNNMTKV